MKSVTLKNLPPACQRPQDLRFFNLRNIRRDVSPRAALDYVGKLAMPSRLEPNHVLSALEQIEQDLGTYGALLFGLLLVSGADQKSLVEGFSQFFVVVKAVEACLEKPHVFESLDPVVSPRLKFRRGERDFKYGLKVLERNFHHSYNEDWQGTGNCVINASLYAVLAIYGGAVVGEQREIIKQHPVVFTLEHPVRNCYWSWDATDITPRFFARPFKDNQIISGPFSLIATLLVYRTWKKWSSQLGEKGLLSSTELEQLSCTLDLAKKINPFSTSLYSLKGAICEMQGNIEQSAKMLEYERVMSEVRVSIGPLNDFIPRWQNRGRPVVVLPADLTQPTPFQIMV